MAGASMFGSAKESIVIVEEKSCGKYSKQLYNLIGTNNDTEDEIVGPADNSVEASIFDEKKFEATPLSSDQKIVFVGRAKAALDYLDAIESEASFKLDKFGIHIHVSGKQAAVYVDKDGLTKEQYWEFLAFACERGINLKDLLADMRPQKHEDTEGDTGDNPVFGFLKTVASLPPVKFAANTAQDAGDNVAVLAKGGEIYDQRFRFAIKLFYLEELRSFVEA